MQQFPKTIPPALHQSSLYPNFAQTKDGESGIILAAVLMLLGIIVALVLQTQVLARSSLNLEKNRLLRTQLRETAGDGIWRALNVLAADQNLLIDHTNEEWAAPMSFRLPNGIDTETIIIDENRFIDANMLAVVSLSEQRRPAAAIVRDLLAAELFSNPELRTQIIQDWVEPTSSRSRNVSGLRRLNQDSNGGYETDYYRRLQGQGEAANALMESREELLWLLEAATNTAAGATELAVLPGIPSLRIEPININTASRQALLAVFGGDNTAMVERIIRGRNAAPLLTLDQVLDPLTMRRYASCLSVRSSFFSVHARAKMGASTEEVYCLAKRDSAGNVQIIRWVEY